MEQHGSEGEGQLIVSLSQTFGDFQILIFQIVPARQPTNEKTRIREAALTRPMRFVELSSPTPASTLNPKRP
jgi:hypothetical protein